MIRIPLIAVALVVTIMPATAETVRLHAAGSLKAAMADITSAFEAKSDGAHKVVAVTGASGLLRERIEKGEPAHVFASADTGHPKRLAELGRTTSQPVVFARNMLCALVRDGLIVTPDTLLDKMLDPNVRIGTSTPKADPSGDYAFALFGKAEAVKPGAKAVLEAKALTLTGGPASEQPPDGRNVYGWVMSSGKADIFLAYCTGAAQAKREMASLQIVAIPQAINVGADYGMVVLKDAPSAAHEFAAFIRSATGKSLLAKHGFGAGD